MAAIPLLVGEEGSPLRREQLRDDPRMIFWWSCRLECASALCRLRRDGDLDDEGLAEALESLDALAGGWHEVHPANEVRSRALRLLRVHLLHTADSLQLAAALVATSEDPSHLPLYTSDERLRDAARKEGFPVG